MALRRGLSFSPASLPLLGLAGLLGCPSAPPPPTTEPPPQSVTVIAAPHSNKAPDTPDTPPNATVKAPPDATQQRGMGWYPNVAVDADNRLHLAYVDADRGDVLYAKSVPGGSALDGEPIAIDTDGAVGAFLSLALAPGGAPVFAYARQDEGVLRVAWRPADRAAMKAAGADVDTGTLPVLPKASRSGSPIEGAAGVIVEEVGFGDQIGRGSSLVVDHAGRLALSYFTSDDRLRLARRPSDVPAFGGAGLGVLEKRDLDPAVASSLRDQTSTLVLDDGTLVVAYAHDVVTDARLRVAVLAPGAERPRVSVVDDDRGIATAGLQSALSLRNTAAGGPVVVDVAYLDTSDKAVFVRSFDLVAGTFGARQKLFDVDGPLALVRRTAQPGTPAGYLAIARQKSDASGGGGVFVYVVDEANADGVVRYDARRIRVDGGLPNSDPSDGWLDIAVRPDGRPAAVWFDRVSSSLKLYAP